MPMLVITSPRFDEHTTPPGHPERPERAHVFDAVAARWLERGGRTAAPRPATEAELLRVHAAAHIRRIAAGARRPGVALDPDTFTSPESYDVALLAAGAAVQAAEHALVHGEPAIALVRPPGHHAEADRAMGFCLFNNVAVAAASAVARGVSRVAIVDIDVHHGNGTQAMFYDDPRVLYVSTHQYPFYPGTGAAEETGRGDGEGFTFNVPLDAGATDADYLAAYAVIAGVLRTFEPELLLVSAGFDAHADDPLASMRVTTMGYAAIVAALAGAVTCPIAAVTEGGYDLRALAGCLEATIAVLDGRTAGTRAGAAAGTPRADRALAAVRAAQAPFWPGI
jgi:acetoin utilization deacetylase AcuC-like enzyme